MREKRCESPQNISKTQLSQPAADGLLHPPIDLIFFFFHSIGAYFAAHFQSLSCRGIIYMIT